MGVKKTDKKAASKGSAASSSDGAPGAKAKETVGSPSPPRQSERPKDPKPQLSPKVMERVAELSSEAPFELGDRTLGTVDRSVGPRFGVGSWGQSIISRIWKLSRWPLLAFLLIWGVLAAHAWKYFSEAGAKGLYFSAIHAIDVLRLPNTPPIPNVPDDLRPLTHEELRELSNGPALRYTYPPRRMYGREVVTIQRFTSANEYTESSTLSIALSIWHGRYLIDNNRICLLPKSSFPGTCYRIYRDNDGNLFEYVPAKRKYPAEWQAIKFHN